MSSHLIMGKRLELIAEVYQAFLDETSTFEDRVGVGLAYLMGEIATDGLFQALDDPEEQSTYYGEFIEKLKELFPLDHVVWTFVDSHEKEMG